MAKTLVSHVQEAEIEFLRRVQGLTLRDKVHSCEIRKFLNNVSRTDTTTQQLVLRQYVTLCDTAFAFL